MKYIFKMLSIMLLAGSMVMVGCKKDENSGDNGTDQTTKYTITVTANVDTMGTVTGGGQYEVNATATLTATPNAGFKFVKWSDGNTNNPRTVTVTANATYTAEFAMKQGIDVTFGTTSWSAKYINAQIASNAVLFSATESSDHTSYPQIYFLNMWESGTPAAGTYTGGATLTEQDQTVNISFSNTDLEYYENSYIELSRNAGDWWSKSVTAHITQLDADALLTSMVINAEMAHVTELFDEEGYLTSIDLNTCTSKTVTVEVNNQTLTRYTGSKSFKTVSTLKLNK